MASNEDIEFLDSAESDLTEILPVGDSIEVVTTSKRVKRGPSAIHWAWEYFRDSDDGNDKICSICNKHFKGRYSNNAEHHLLSKHKDRCQEFHEKRNAFESAKRQSEPDQNQSKISAFLPSTKSKRPQYTSEQLRQLAILVSCTSLPFSIIDSDEFENFCKALKPDFAVPNKKTVLKQIAAIHLQLKGVMLDFLESAGKITLCIDEWTTRGMTMSVIGVTAHFYSRKTHKLSRLLLALRRITNRTSDNIRQMIAGILQEWNIPETKVWRVVTDNAKNMVKAFHSISLDGGEYIGLESVAQIRPDEAMADKNLDESFDDDAMEEYLPDDDGGYLEEAFDKQKHLPCFLHTLVLAFKNVINSNDSEVFEALRDARRLVNVFSHSAKATEHLIEISGRKLLLPTRTRWNYIYHTLKRLLELRQSVTEVCEEQKIANISNWRMLLDLVKILEPFSKVIDLQQGESYVTIAQVMTCISGLQHHLNDMIDHDVLPNLCGQINAEIERRFKKFLSTSATDFNPTYIIGSALHPTLALLLNQDNLAYARQAIIRFLRFEFASSDTLPPQEAAHADAGDEVPYGDLFPHLKQKILEAKQQRVSAVSSVEEEVNSYFKELTLFPNIKDPLNFWQRRRNEFPSLSDYACDVLAIPASSAAVESVFSVAGHATSGRRHNLSVNLEREVMLKVNKWCL